MNEDLSRKRLGRGLAALIGEIDKVEEPEKLMATADGLVPIEFIIPNPRNPRRTFAEDDLADLAQSIHQHGLVQPVVVRPAEQCGRYEIIAGERRWRASQRAGITEIPVIVREVNDRTALELAIIENVQRTDLNAIEEALGYQQLIEEHNYTQAYLGQVIGKSRSYVANTLRLLNLPDVVRNMLINGELSAGHARSLITAEDPVTLAKRIIKGGLSVRQAEVLAHLPTSAVAEDKQQRALDKDYNTVALEKLLTDVVGMRISITYKDNGGGELRVTYNSLEQLDDLCRRLKNEHV